MMSNVTLTLLTDEDRERFILENQRAFRFGAMAESGNQDDRSGEEREVISREIIERSIDGGTAYCIREDGKFAGGLVVRIDEKTQHNHLELLFVLPELHSRGLGFAAWQAVERLYPETRAWETCTPYFDKRNIHFYINKCGFHAVEFFQRFHPDPHDPETGEQNNYDGDDGFEGMFRFEKRMKQE